MSRDKSIMLYIASGMLTISTLVGSITIYADWRCAAADATCSDIGIDWYIGLLNLLAILILPLGLLCILGTRRRGGIVFVSITAYMAGWIICGKIGNHIRMRAFDRLATRSAPLVHAIEKYRSTHNQCPESLTNLVPEFLPTIPITGMGAYPDYEYATGTNTWHDNPYVLFVHTPRGGLNWDMFLYFPKQNYPKEGFGGALERIGDWAYVHE